MTKKKKRSCNRGISKRFGHSFSPLMHYEFHDFMLEHLEKTSLAFRLPADLLRKASEVSALCPHGYDWDECPDCRH